jgi:putative transposase
MLWGLTPLHHSGQSHFVTFCCYYRRRFVYHGRKQTNPRVSLGARAGQFRASRLRVRSHAGACSPPAQRTTTGCAGRCAEGVEARSVAAFDRRCGAFLAEEVLRFQPSQLPQFVEKLRYIHRNPVKAGLCERSKDWQWSSFRHHATGSEGRIEIESNCPLKPKSDLSGPPSPVRFAAASC